MRTQEKTPRCLASVTHIFFPIILLKLVSCNGFIGDNCVSSVEGVALLNHTYKSLVVRDMFACYYHCKGDALCQSLNFYRNNNLCEMNNRTRSVRRLNLIADSNAVHLDNPFRAVLGLSPLLPAQSCREIKNASEGLAPSGRYWLSVARPGDEVVSAYCDMKNEVIVQCNGNPCQNEGSCDYRGDDHYTCRCLPGFTGNHCENQDNCLSHPCLNGGTCLDTGNGFICVCMALLTGKLCQLGIGEECSRYIMNAESDRSVSYSTGGSAKCDKLITEDWYRFNNSAGSKIPNYCVPQMKCNTHAPGWLNGTHPTPQEGIVHRNVCFHWRSNCCNWVSAIKVRNCGLFYVYNLVITSHCNLRYCVTQ